MKWRLTLALALTVGGMLSGCSSTDDADIEPVELVDFEPTAKVERLWSTSVGDGAGDFFTLLPMASNDELLFVVDIHGYLAAIDRETGKKRWAQKLRTEIASGVGSARGVVYVGTTGGEVIALQAEDGEELWRSQLSSEILSPPQSNGSEVVVQTQDGKLFALNAKDGVEIWHQDTSLPALTLRGTSTPVVTDTSVYSGFETGKILAIDIKDGTLQWEQRVAFPQGRSELERVVDINGAPLLVGDILYSGSYQGRLLALNRGTGRPLWNQKASTYNNLGAALGRVFMSSANSEVKAFDAYSGELQWTNDQMLRRKISAPTTFSRYVAVGDLDGYVHIMTQSDGQFVARRKVDGDGVRSPMLGLGDVLYVYGNSGEVEALRIQED